MKTTRKSHIYPGKDKGSWLQWIHASSPLASTIFMAARHGNAGEKNMFVAIHEYFMETYSDTK